MVPHLLFMMLGAVFHLGLTVYGEASMKASLKSLHVMSDIKYRFATTQISMTYYNPYNSTVTAKLHVNMPHNSFISNFTMEIDGNVTVGEVKEKAIAKEIFEDAIQAGQSAGYVEVKHRFTNIFDISMNVESQKYIVYNLTYQELLTREANKYRHIIHLSNGGIIDDFLVEVFITEPQDIIDLVVPKIKDDKLTDITDDGELESALIEYISSRDVYIKYNPSRKQQEEISKDGVAGLLKVAYDVDRKNDSNLIYAVDGYFVHFFTPDSLPTLPKHIIFMLDVSGSMHGGKIKQLKEAMENILDQLDPELDKFLIGKFSSGVSWMRKTFKTANQVNKQLGKNYIERLVASGGTNINSALLESIEKHKSVSSTTKKDIIIFLTDGDPTSGITNLEQIKRNVKEANQNISLFALGFGEDCDSKFLREIATENGGFSRKIYVDSDSKLQIENLYKEISNILLKDITFVYLNEAVNTSVLSATSFSSYFKGSEIVVSGVLLQQNQSTMNVNVTMTGCWGPDNEILELEIYGGDLTINDDLPQNPNLTSFQSFSEITEKTYAYLTLKQLLKEDRTTQVRNDILDLALKYNFVTALTSMVVTKSRVKEELFEEDDEDTLQPPSYPIPYGPVGLHPVAYDPVGRQNNILHVQYMPPPARTPQIAFTHRYAVMTNTYPPPSRTPRPTSPPPRYTHSSTSRTQFLTTTKLPILSHKPAIVITPSNCSVNLCFTDHIQCNNKTKIILLSDKVSNIYVYGYVKNISNTNCLETLNRVIVKNNNAVVAELTPDLFKIKGKTHVPKRKQRIFKMKRTLWIIINLHKTVNSETFLSLHFIILTKFLQPKGILSDYATDFHCTENQPNQMKLSNKAAIFNKVNYQTASGSVDQCYKM